MITNKDRSTSKRTRASFNRVVPFAAAALLAVAWVPAATAGNGNDDYQQTNLVSDLAGVTQLQDTNLVNAWGISMNGNSPFWRLATGWSKGAVREVRLNHRGTQSTRSAPA